MTRVVEKTAITKTYKMYPETIDKVKEVQALYKKKKGYITQAQLLDMAIELLKKELA